MSEQKPEAKKQPGKERQILVMAVLFVGLVILVLLVNTFNNRLANDRRLSREMLLVEKRLDDQLGTKAALIAAIDKAGSDRAVEAWARGPGKMKQPGDMQVVLVAPEDAVPVTTPMPTPIVVEKSNREKWLDLFFGP